MKTIKVILPVLFALITTFTARAYILFEDNTNYPYVNGSIEGQGQWYTPAPAPFHDALVTNNVLLLYSNHQDDVEAPTNLATGPTNGWINTDNPNLTFASFQVMVTQLPEESGDDDFFCQFRNGYPSGNTNADSAGRVFIDTLNTSVPGTFHLGIGNFDTEFEGQDADFPPINYPEDLATDTWYTVVMAYGNNSSPGYALGGTLWINPSPQDYQNFVNNTEPTLYTDTNASGNYVYTTDTTTIPADLNIIVSQIEFMPGSSSGNEGISNVIAGSEFSDVFTTSLPVFGIQPLDADTNSTETNYSGNNVTLYAVASGIDLTYQWYSQNYGLLTNGLSYANGDGFFGVTNDTLVVSNLSLTDTYHCVVTDYYGHTAASSNATEVIITTPTPVFFSSTYSPTNETNNVFQTVNFYDKAAGSGPISYQWYYEKTNTTTYLPLVGSNQDYINLYLSDYSSQGNYYVLASNSVNGGSIAFGPTNTLVELAPTTVTLAQLHQLLVTFFQNQTTIVSGTTYYLNQGGSSGTPITVGGYVTTYGIPVPGDTNFNGLAVGGLGNTYAEYYLQDASGYGAEVYGVHETNNYQPPIGTYVTVSGLVEVYNCGLEVAPSSAAAITLSNNAAPITINPLLANAQFNQLATNMLSPSSLALNETMITFTNVYTYSSRQGASISIGGYNYNGEFAPNRGNSFYFTVGSPYNPTNPATGLGLNPALPVNTNMLECYQFVYDYPDQQATTALNPFDNLTIPSYCYQLTGVYVPYGTLTAQGPEILPSRLADYVLTPPSPSTNTVTVSGGVSTISWSGQVGSTYSVYSATNLLGPWTQAAYGVTYYPSNGVFTDTAKAPAKFYQVTSP
ncbi:MAG TPA: hypothetical protein VK811_04730 [Candidatus Acidoferrum sp.]|jgi:hypothetical protein|nr:hypothetical protein [Candidatus Acidoferrum sp.]